MILESHSSPQALEPKGRRETAENSPPPPWRGGGWGGACTAFLEEGPATARLSPSGSEQNLPCAPPSSPPSSTQERSQRLGKDGGANLGAGVARAPLRPQLAVRSGIGPRAPGGLPFSMQPPRSSWAVPAGS